jgi:16S rRNA (adenine1518-N6/adenine1519-N6)-dimethyltransferase
MVDTASGDGCIGIILLSVPSDTGGKKDGPLQTQTTIRALLAEAGRRPNRKLGQHFLIDGNLMRKLIASADIQPGDVVLEVGCGTGSLTEELAALAGAVVAVEADQSLANIAAGQLADVANVVLLDRDVLLSKSQIEPVVLDAVVNAQEQASGRFLLVANLPYQVASPLIIDLLTGRVEPARMCVTVQKEVSDRLLARPGGKAYGPLSIIVQASTEVRRIAPVPPSAFWPAPTVDSAMLRIDLLPDRRQRIGDLAHFASVVRACFMHRRKTLAHNLVTSYGAAAAGVLARLEVERRARPEQLAPSLWVELARALTM